MQDIVSKDRRIIEMHLESQADGLASETDQAAKWRLLINAYAREGDSASAVRVFKKKDFRIHFAVDDFIDALSLIQPEQIRDRGIRHRVLLIAAEFMRAKCDDEQARDLCERVLNFALETGDLLLATKAAGNLFAIFDRLGNGSLARKFAELGYSLVPRLPSNNSSIENIRGLELRRGTERDYAEFQFGGRVPCDSSWLSINRFLREPIYVETRGTVAWKIIRFAVDAQCVQVESELRNIDRRILVALEKLGHSRLEKGVLTLARGKLWSPFCESEARRYYEVAQDIFSTMGCLDLETLAKANTNQLRNGRGTISN